MKRLKASKVLPRVQPITIHDCTLSCNSTPPTKEQAEAIVALARAIQANAMAAQELARGLYSPGPEALIKVN